MKFRLDDKPNSDGLIEMEEILEEADVGRLALSDSSKPYMIPLNFIYTKGKIAFHCAWKGKKLELIAINPDCCFEVDDFKGDLSYHYESKCHLDYDSVLAFGKARIENDDEEKIRLLQLFAEKYDEKYRKSESGRGKRLGKKDLKECCCVVIEIKEITGRRERTKEGKIQKTMWQHIF